MNADIVVLGAGPAGVAISLLLSQRGYSVEVFDPSFFPRKKICGEFLNPQAVQWIKAQGLLEKLLDIEPFPIHGMKLHNRTGAAFTGRYKTENHNSSYSQKTGYAVMRESFDTLMLSHAKEQGITIREGFRAKRLLMNDSGACGVSGIDANGCSFEARARIVVGADGRNNLIGRTFGWVRPIRRLRKYAFQTYMADVPGLDHFGEVHLVRDGYIGIAPLNNSLANIALVVDEKAYPGGESDPVQFLMERIGESRLADRFHGMRPCSSMLTAGPLAFETIRTSGYRTLLVGDTCGFIDPFTGEGINYAFLSAGIAAEVLDHSFRNKAFDDRTLSKYDKKRRQEFSRKWLISRLLQLAIERPELAESLIRRFSQKQDLADTIVSAIGSSLPVKSVWNAGFVLRFLAGKRDSEKR